MSAMQRRKGKAGELEVVKLAKEAGFADARRTAPMQCATGDERDADVGGVGRLFAEVKRHARVNVQGCMADLLATERPGFIRVLFHRSNRGPWLCTLEAAELLKLERDALAGAVERVIADADRKFCPNRANLTLKGDCGCCPKQVERGEGA